jgi:hypothetical protein
LQLGVTALLSLRRFAAAIVDYGQGRLLEKHVTPLGISLVGAKVAGA